MSQRDSVTRLAPPWLRGYNTNGEKYLYTFGLANDLLIEKMQQGVLARMPGRALTDTAIPLQAADRLLVQGPGETNDQFTARLTGALDAWSIAGSRRASLEQLHAYLIGRSPGVALTMPEMLIVGGNQELSTWDSLTIGDPQRGAPAHRLVQPANWRWDDITGLSGSSATVAAAGATTTITDLVGLSQADVGLMLTLSNTEQASNAGTFTILQVLSASSAVIQNANGNVSDANNGTIVWSVAPAERPWRSWLVLFMALVATGLSGTTGAIDSTGGSGVTGVTSGFATLSGLAGLSSANVQQYITLSNTTIAGNSGTFQIVAVPDATHAIIANPAANAFDSNSTNWVWSIGSYPFIAPAPVWGSPGFVWGATTWGCTQPDTIAAIREILRRWKSANAYYPNIIIAFGGGDGTAGNDFSPLSGVGTGNPDGTWGGWNKTVNGVSVPSKTPQNAFTAFCDGTAMYRKCSVPNVT